jgi:hypothetical protein
MGVAILGAMPALQQRTLGRLLNLPGLYPASLVYRLLDLPIDRGRNLSFVVVNGLVWGLSIFAAWTVFRSARRGMRALSATPDPPGLSLAADALPAEEEVRPAKALPRLGLALLVSAALVPGGIWFRDSRAAAGCLDRGGSYNDSTGQCDFVALHARVPFGSRHPALVVASAIALLLGAVLLARGGGKLPILPFRSAAEKRALLSCFGLGLVAVGLGAFGLVAGHLPPFLHGWDSRGRDFPRAALVLGFDALLVLAGSRGPRKVTVAAAGLLGLALLLFAGFAFLGGCFVAGMVGETDALQVFIPLVLMGMVQWLGLKAVSEQL